MHITIIGGSGFVGTRLVMRLFDAGHTVIIADKNDSESIPVFAFMPMSGNRMPWKKFLPVPMRLSILLRNTGTMLPQNLCTMM
jgi:nucleoside-diphosphate-sugar epimerase